MSTDEALKKFVETCDKDGVTLGEMTDAFKELEKTLYHPLQCDSSFCDAPLNEKINALADYTLMNRVKKFVKFINLKPDKTIKRAETLQEIQDACRNFQIAYVLKVSAESACGTIPQPQPQSHKQSEEQNE